MQSLFVIPNLALSFLVLFPLLLLLTLYCYSEISMALAHEIPMDCEWQSILTNLLALQHMHFLVNQQSTARNFPWYPGYPHEKSPLNPYSIPIRSPVSPFRPVAEVQSQIQPTTQPLAAPAGRSSGIAAGPGICCVTDEPFFRISYWSILDPNYMDHNIKWIVIICHNYRYHVDQQ